MAALFLWMAATPASAESRRIELPQHCWIATGPNATAAQVFAKRTQFQCGNRLAYAEGRTNWALISGLDIAPVPNDPWHFRHALGRERGEQVWFGFADGALLPSPTDAQAARQIFSSADVVFDVPVRTAPLTAILVRVENMQAIRGLVPRPGLGTASARAATSSSFHMFYGFFGGLITAMLLFNFTLFLVMRHRFQLNYCLFALAAASFAFSWSGGIFLLFPDMTTFEQVRANNFAIAFCLFTAPLFYLSFLEPGMIGRRMTMLLRITAVLPLAVTLGRGIAPDTLWRVIDTIFYGNLLCGITVMAVSSILAWRKGSRAVRFIVLSWCLPYFLVAMRGLWALDIVTLHTGWFDISPFMAIAYEAAVSSIGLGWRIRELRRDRDEARGREEALTILADTDALTDLLNRRAFIERAQVMAGIKTLILFDIDRFKTINDAYGHDVGDTVLSEVAATIRNHLPRDGHAGRIGGEEFAILVPGADGTALAEAVREAIMAIRLPGGEIVTASAGAAACLFEDEAGWRHAYIGADQALYAAKQSGRNQVRKAALPLAA